MLILCMGPDTFRAQARARELEEAFRQKFNLDGSSMERLSGGKEAVKQILERANTASLFSSHRMLRGTDLLLECPKASQAVLAQALSKDPDNIIVISVESEPPPETTLKAFAGVPKLVKEPFPVQTGAAFRTWLMERAQSIRYQNEARIKDIAAFADGDSWLAWNELLKTAAGGLADQRIAPQPSVYDYCEKFLAQGDATYAYLSDRNISGEILPILLNQVRAAIRVRDNDTEGLHPFVVKKMKYVSKQNISMESMLAGVLQAFLVQRAGLGNEEEAALLF